jgi:hypothetical protein
MNIFDNLPVWLEILYIYIDNFNFDLTHLPNLKQLIIQCENFNKSIDLLPISLEILEIYSYKFNQPVDNLGMNIEKLHIASKNFKQSLENVKYIKDISITHY